MMFFLVCVFAVGAKVSATTPIKLPPGCPIPCGPCDPPDCGPNAYFEVCSYPCPPQNCSSLWTKYRCKEECCKPECRCKDGFLRDDKTGRCIGQDKCSNPKCPLDEVFDRCSAHCEPTCANHGPNRPCSKICKPGCKCRDPLVRRKDGKCVELKKCPPPRCNANETYSECGSACPTTCDTYGNTCIICTEQCIKGCFCNKGLVRAEDGRCIAPKDCRPRHCSDPNETFDWCPPPCPPGDDCSNMWTKYDCSKFPDCCKPQCRCKSGYLRKDGRCVPTEQCTTPVCKENEKYLECGTACPLTCDNYKTPPPCLDVCVAGCFCVDGYVRDRNNRCVRREDCANPKCPLDEVFDRCSAHCEPTCANHGPNRPCSKICKPGCKCRDPLVRRKDGKCVELKKCPPPRCNANETYSECGSACPTTCDTYGNTCIICTKQCVKGCFCNKGLVRAEDGRCIAPKDCRPRHCSDPNEKFDWCPPPCPPGDDCSNMWTKYDCSKFPDCCKPQCRCKSGYLRKDGRCVPTEQCTTPVCKENEKYLECGTACPLTCDNYKTPPPCLDVCVAGCFCVDGYVRDRNNRCVRREDCANPKCPLDEVFDRCSAHCEPTCANHGPNRPCSKICKPGCKCRDPLVRRKDGKCVELKKCPPPRCNANETYSECGSACPTTCDTYGNTCIICTKQCVKGCFCNKGLVRAEDGRCIAPKDCRPRHCSDPNEKFDWCPPPCPPGDDCSNMWTKYDCSKFPDCCKPQCRCKSGYLRKDGRCVPTEQCTTPVCKEHEKYLECGTACPLTCDNYKTPPPCLDVCVAGCFCVDGYVRDRNNRCVRREDCANPKCPLDEVFDRCSAHCEPTCANHGPNRPCSKICKPGCKCRDPLVRRKDGKCVELKKCPPPRCNANETYSECGSACPTTCDTYGNTCIICTDQCVKGCFCNKGLVRAEDGRCIAPKDCRPRHCSDPNEKFDWCPPPCPPGDDCSNMWTKYDCSKFPDCCKPQCRCKSGYLRKDGRCVPTEQCTTPVCKENEKYLECGTACPLTCDNYKTPPPCLDVCVAGCFCVDGYVRDRNNRCVRREDCANPKCPLDEVFDRCSAHCEPTCANHGPNRPCSKICKPGCKCRDPLVRRKDGKCVELKKCPPPRCNANETYSECGSACPTTCDTYGNTCIICTKQCVKGCFCNKGLVRAEDGRCIAPKDCRPRHCSDPNEKFDWCPPPCPPGDDCSNMWTKYDCSKFPDCCKPQCRCKSGYLRKDGRCVPTEQCTTPVCKENEKYLECGTACPLTCDNYKTPPPCLDVCVAGCFCVDGYVRDRNNRCVRREDCDVICPPGEKYDKCYAHCQDTCENYNVTNRPCTHQCQPGCVCDKGTVRRKDGQCVPPRECTEPTCPVDEVYSKCSAHCEPTCENHDPNRPCTKICKPGCKCRHPLVRRKDCKCVKVDECSPRRCSDPNEVFDWCPPRCPPGDDCSNMWTKYDCSKFPDCCKAQCRCKSGYLRKDGRCVPTEQCTSRG